MNRIDQYPGRGSGSSCRDQKNPANVTAAAASQMITPTARTHGVDPNDITMRPAMATASPTYPTRRAQTAILQCPLYCSSGGSSMPGIVPRLRDQGHWSPSVLRGMPVPSGTPSAASHSPMYVSENPDCPTNPAFPLGDGGGHPTGQPAGDLSVNCVLGQGPTPSSTIRVVLYVKGGVMYDSRRLTPLVVVPMMYETRATTHNTATTGTGSPTCASVIPFLFVHEQIVKAWESPGDIVVSPASGASMEGDYDPGAGSCEPAQRSCEKST